MCTLRHGLAHAVVLRCLHRNANKRARHSSVGQREQSIYAICRFDTTIPDLNFAYNID